MIPQTRLSRLILITVRLMRLAQESPHIPAARISHKAQKSIYEKRRATKSHADLVAEAKRVWALASQKTLPAAERQTHVKNLMNLIRGHVSDIVFKHDASRIVQTIVKYGRKEERDEVATELKGKYRQLAQRKYSKVRLYPSLHPLVSCLSLHSFLSRN